MWIERGYCKNEESTRMAWLDSKTEPELAYWTIKYILMRNSKPWSEMGDMSQQM